VDDSGRCSDEPWMAVCPLDRLRERMMVCTTVGKQDVVLIWNEGLAVACERACPHEQADLSRGQVSNGRLLCPRHAASFDLSDGAVSAGWPSRPLRIYPARILRGQIWINLEAAS
jgi:3-phenylpropionate/trans-cinnamate dioxygenase ferredoxin subunit